MVCFVENAVTVYVMKQNIFSMAGGVDAHVSTEYR